jgi:hypothetical protein
MLEAGSKLRNLGTEKGYGVRSTLFTGGIHKKVGLLLTAKSNGGRG